EILAGVVKHGRSLSDLDPAVPVVVDAGGVVGPDDDGALVLMDDRGPLELLSGPELAVAVDRGLDPAGVVEPDLARRGLAPGAIDGPARRDDRRLLGPGQQCCEPPGDDLGRARRRQAAV